MSGGAVPRALLGAIAGLALLPTSCAPADTAQGGASARGHDRRLLGSWFADDPSGKVAPTELLLVPIDETQLFVEVLYHGRAPARFRALPLEIDGVDFFVVEPLVTPLEDRPRAIARCMLADSGRDLSLRFIDDPEAAAAARDPARLAQRLRELSKDPRFLEATEPSVSGNGIPYRWRRPRAGELEAARAGR